jgi:hypothetical protein
MNLPHVRLLDPLLIAGVIAGLAVLLFAIGFWWWWPKREIGRLRPMIFDSAARANAEDNIRKTIGQLLGGAAVLIGAGLAYLQFSQQQQTAQQQFTQQRQASHDLLISNQVSKGFEQLGSDKVVVRLGGIYALEGVMNTSEQYHQPVLEALCAFVRDGTRTEKGDGPPTTDIQAALTVIGRRSRGLGRVDLTEAHIPKAYLSGGNLGPMTKLSKADLRGANLIMGYMLGANLVGADLRSALLSAADLSRTDLRGANLSGAELPTVRLSGADLRGANLSGAFLFDTRLDGATLSNADLSGSSISQTQLDEACGEGAKLPPGMNLKPCR